jgi:hypothetical protein
MGTDSLLRQLIVDQCAVEIKLAFQHGSPFKGSVFQL